MRRSRKRMNAVGARTKKWQQIREEVVDPELELMGVNECEFIDRLPGDCWGRLERAHSKKRRKLQTLQDWAEVAIGCHAHHEYMDLHMTAEEMEAEVKAAIARRRRPGYLSPELRLPS